jgi:hypothetical protein
MLPWRPVRSPGEHVDRSSERKSDGSRSVRSCRRLKAERECTRAANVSSMFWRCRPRNWLELLRRGLGAVRCQQSGPVVTVWRLFRPALSIRTIPHFLDSVRAGVPETSISSLVIELPSPVTFRRVAPGPFLAACIREGTRGLREAGGLGERSPVLRSHGPVLLLASRAAGAWAEAFHAKSHRRGGRGHVAT